MADESIRQRKARQKKCREGDVCIEPQLSERLRAITAGMSAIATPVTVSVHEVLQRIADVARDLVGAEYCALGIGTDPSTSFRPWVFSGISEEQARDIGRHPRPIGLLGAVPHENRIIRVRDLSQDSRFHGWPAHHPDMRSFLGVPIRIGERGVGNLYLTNKVGAEEFSAEDQLIAEALAVHAGVAMESARLYEEAKQRAAELEEEKTRREAFVSAVAHELRNPLTIILGGADLLRLQWERLDAERRRGTIESIANQGRHLSRLVADLLEASQITSGRFSIETAAMDLVAVARSIVQGHSHTSRHELVLEAPDSLKGTWDRDRIAQAINNLISNALKYSPEGTLVRVELRREAEEALVSVSDQGPGMAPEEIPLLFQPYSRFYRQSRARGLGLGLHITKGIVEAHGGRIWVQSPGRDQGSTFCFTLPLSAR
ncbi:MAG: GAF domain-containing sensor histidine kinase [Chloroflexota bacterium]|nr:MAG: GAF domain-containing sensor histidine kinase [Chloroflexota bacterium]